MPKLEDVSVSRRHQNLLFIAYEVADRQDIACVASLEIFCFLLKPDAFTYLVARQQIGDAQYRIPAAVLLVLGFSSDQVVDRRHVVARIEVDIFVFQSLLGQTDHFFFVLGRPQFYFFWLEYSFH